MQAPPAAPLSMPKIAVASVIGAALLSVITLVVTICSDLAVPARVSCANAGAQ